MKITDHKDPLDTVFAALAHSKRRALVHYLSLRPGTIKQLAEAHDLSLPMIHKHLKALEDAGLIIRRKVGRTNFLTLNKSSLKLLQAWVMQYHSEWGNDQETLDNYIEGMRRDGSEE